MKQLQESVKAFKLEEVAQAVQHELPIGPQHPFFVDFSRVRGDFKEQIVYSSLNVALEDQMPRFNPATSGGSKKLLFLGGMRGSGKTSELAKIGAFLHKPSCFFVVTCNVDLELDMNDVEYVDILILQMQRLVQMLDSAGVDMAAGAAHVRKMQSWFETVDKEAKRAVKVGLDVEAGVKAEAGEGALKLLGPVLSLLGSLRLGFSGSKEWVQSTRSSIRNRFGEFADIFNTFIHEANIALRKAGRGQEVLFIIDGLEKTWTADHRRKIIIEDSNRLRQIHAYTIFTLPIELMKERTKLQQFSKVESFPFVKVRLRDGSPHREAIRLFREFVYLRIEKALFEDEDLVEEMILLSGGSPRQLLQILEMTRIHASGKKLDRAAFEEAKRRMVNEMASHVTQEQVDCLKRMNAANKTGRPVLFDAVLEDLLEDVKVMEYNDNSDKRVNPLLEASHVYRAEVLGEA